MCTLKFNCSTPYTLIYFVFISNRHLTAVSDDNMYCRVCPTVNATAYCTQCGIYLCPTCAKHHNILPLSVSHKLLQGDNFTSLYPTLHVENNKQCPNHPDEDIKLYCQNHEALCCCACSAENHNECKPKYIPNISKDFKTSQDYTHFKADFESFEV